MKGAAVIGITYTEFQTLYNYRSIQIDRSRISPLQLADGGDVDNFGIDLAVGRLPNIDPCDEAGAMFAICRLDDINNTPASNFLSFILEFDYLEELIPLTEVGAKLLSSRLDPLGIRLSKPRFEQAVQKSRLEKIKRSASNGAVALVNALLSSAENSVEDSIRACAETAVMNCEQVNRTGAVDWEAQAPVCLVTDCMRFTRNRPDKDLGSDIEVLRDLAEIVRGSSYEKRVDFESSYSEICKSIANFYSQPYKLERLIENEQISSAFGKIGEMHASYLPASIRLESILGFLKLKHEYHKGGDSFDSEQASVLIEAIGNNLDKRSAAATIWIFGSYLGHDRLAPLLYSTLDTKLITNEHKFLRPVKLDFDDKVSTPADSLDETDDDELLPSPVAEDTIKPLVQEQLVEEAPNSRDEPLSSSQITTEAIPHEVEEITAAIVEALEKPIGIRGLMKALKESSAQITVKQGELKHYLTKLEGTVTSKGADGKYTRI